MNPGSALWASPGSAVPSTFATFELGAAADVRDIELADIDQDGLEDISMVARSSGLVATIVNPGRPGTASSVGASAASWMAAPTNRLTPSTAPRQVELADVNKDGHIDLVVGTSTSILIYLGSAGSTSTGAFSAAPIGVGASLLPSLDTQCLEVADADGDGWVDILASYDPAVYGAASSPHHKRIFYGSGTIGASPSGWANAPAVKLGASAENEWDVESMDVVDLNNDGERREATSLCLILWPLPQLLAAPWP